MSEFMERARAEAEQTIDHMGEGAWADGVRYGIYVGVASASEQEPTDAEVEAACRAFYEATNPRMDPSMQLSWDRLNAGDPAVAENYRRALMPALLAAQKVRVGL